MNILAQLWQGLQQPAVLMHTLRTAGKYPGGPSTHACCSNATQVQRCSLKLMRDYQHAAFAVRRAKTHRHVLHLLYAMRLLHRKQNVPASRLRCGFAAAVGQRGLADVELGWSSQKRHSDSLPSIVKLSVMSFRSPHIAALKVSL